MDKYIWSKIDKYAKKLKAINYLGGKCEKCEESDFFKLSFHHINPTEKERTIDSLKLSRWSNILKELNKCKLLCHNCHHEEHSTTFKI